MLRKKREGISEEKKIIDLTLRSPGNFCYGCVELFSVVHKDQKGFLQKEIILKTRFKQSVLKL